MKFKLGDYKDLEEFKSNLPTAGFYEVLPIRFIEEFYKLLFILANKNITIAKGNFDTFFIKSIQYILDLFPYNFIEEIDQQQNEN